MKYKSKFSIMLATTLMMSSIVYGITPFAVDTPKANQVAATVLANTIAGVQISEYSSSFENGKQSRIDNITLASIAIDEKVVNPGEVFSFNETVGPTNRQRGYKKARIFVNGVESEGYGGGVCQVSSTLYNAALEAGLTIVERHPHSLPVTYVPEGRDAATSYGGVDMKFKNDFEFPIRVNSYLMNQNIYIAIEK